MSILKSADAEGSACARYTYEYPGVNGVGHFLHTYVQDGNPIPTFQGEPERVAITGTLDAFAGDDLEQPQRSQQDFSLRSLYRSGHGCVPGETVQ